MHTVHSAASLEVNTSDPAPPCEDKDARLESAPVHEAEAAGEAALVLRRVHGDVVVDALAPAQPCIARDSACVWSALQAFELCSNAEHVPCHQL